MGHHSNVTVESANNAYVSPLQQPTQPLQTAAAAAGPRDAIGRTTVVFGGVATAVRNGNGSSTAGGPGNNSNNNNNNCTGATGTAVAAAMRNGTTAPDRLSSGYYYYHSYDNATETALLFFPLNRTTTAAGRPDVPFEKPANCAWIPAQQSLFQFSNICFLTAFIVPRSYKLSVLSLR